MTQVTLLTGPERRRRWSSADRARILAAAFAPGSVVTDVARQFDVSSSLIYKWRRAGLEMVKTGGFASAVLLDEPRSAAATILVELGGARVSIAADAPIALVTAALQALR